MVVLNMKSVALRCVFNPCKCYEESLKLYPPNPAQICYHLGYCHEMIGEYLKACNYYKEALESYDKRMKEKPTDRGARYILDNCKEALQRIEKEEK